MTGDNHYLEIQRTKGDAIVASVCRSQKGSFLVTFDRKFINALKKIDLAVASH